MKIFPLILFATTFCFPFISFAQDERLQPDRIRQMHHETLEDKYLPNAFGNKKTAPGYKYKSSGARLKKDSKPTIMSASVFTVQVNVDAAGQNILGDAANEPNITVNPQNPNVIVIGWRQFDNVASNFRQAGWSYSSDAGQTWTFPGVIEPGIFRSDPVLDFDSSGTFYYNSGTSTYACKLFKSYDSGVSWDSGTDAAGGDKQWMAIDRTAGAGNGNIYSSWTSNFSTCSPGFFTRSTDGGGSFESCIMVDGDPYWVTMAVGNAGELFIAGGGNVPESLVVAKSLNAQIAGSSITWNIPSQVYMDGVLDYTPPINPGGFLGQVNIDVDRSNGPGRGNVYVLASLRRISNTDPADVMFSRSVDGGQTWSAPIRVNDDSSISNMQWFGAMTVAPNGRLDAVWLDTRDNPGSDSSALYYSYSTDLGNTWSTNEKLSDSFDPHIGYPNQLKLGDYLDLMSDDSGVSMAWSNTLNGEEDVYYSRIIPEITTGKIEIDRQKEFVVYPNPASTSLTIQCTAVPSNIEIYAVPGEKVYSTSLLKTTSEIDISNLPAGMYFLKIFDNDGSTGIKKIIKN